MPQVASDIVVESGMRPLDPALADELALGPNPASSGRDVVLGGINGFVNDQSGEQTSRPRGAWRRAHEQVRSLTRESRLPLEPLRQEVASDELTGLSYSVLAPSGDPSPAADIVVESPVPPPPSAFWRDLEPVPPVDLGEIGRHFPEMTVFPDDERKFSSVPPQVAGFDLPFKGKSNGKRQPLRAGFTEEELQATEWMTTPIATPDLPEPETGPPVLDAYDSSTEHRVEAESMVAPDELVDVAVFESDFSVLSDAELFDSPRDLVRRNRRGRGPSGHRRGEVRIPLADLDDSVEGEEELSSSEPDSEVPVIPLWAEIDHECRTCRDFRPAESGERGWCTNKWAFSHRRMVDADECPCTTTIGGWWVPRDDFWLAKADVSRHSQPTPLLDRFLAQRRNSSGESDQEPQLRRRQR